jgi:hypothetical protein
MALLRYNLLAVLNSTGTGPVRTLLTARSQCTLQAQVTSLLCAAFQRGRISFSICLRTHRLGNGLDDQTAFSQL